MLTWPACRRSSQALPEADAADVRIGAGHRQGQRATQDGMVNRSGLLEPGRGHVVGRPSLVMPMPTMTSGPSRRWQPPLGLQEAARAVYFLNRKQPLLNDLAAQTTVWSEMAVGISAATSIGDSAANMATCSRDRRQRAPN
jgi:hypothetical protein